MNSTLHVSTSKGKSNAAFTLIELLVIIAMLSLLAVTLLPALAHTQPDSRSFRCLNNQRQLMAAWRMYAEDHNDFLAANDFPYLTTLSSIVPIQNASNWAPGAMGTSDGTDPRILKDQRFSQLYSFLKNTGVFKCPADKANWLRSVSMNSAVGTRFYDITSSPVAATRGSAPVHGGWLLGTGYNSGQTTWRTYGKMSSISAPTPAGLWIIMDEHPFSINDSSVAMPAVPDHLIDFPASYHDGAGTVSFADGHSEIHKWLDGRTRNPRTSGGGPNSVQADHTTGNADTVWISQRTSAPR